jgi:hypothetical protein
MAGAQGLEMSKKEIPFVEKRDLEELFLICGISPNRLNHLSELTIARSGPVGKDNGASVRLCQLAPYSCRQIGRSGGRGGRLVAAVTLARELQNGSPRVRSAIADSIAIANLVVAEMKATH